MVGEVETVKTNAGWDAWGDLSRPSEEYIEYFKPALGVEYRVGFSSVKTEIRKYEHDGKPAHPVMILTIDYLNGSPPMRPLILSSSSRQLASDICQLERRGFLFSAILKLKALERVFSTQEGEDIRHISYKLDLYSTKPVAQQKQ